MCSEPSSRNWRAKLGSCQAPCSQATDSTQATHSVPSSILRKSSSLQWDRMDRSCSTVTQPMSVMQSLYLMSTSVASLLSLGAPHPDSAAMLQCTWPSDLLMHSDWRGHRPVRERARIPHTCVTLTVLPAVLQAIRHTSYYFITKPYSVHGSLYIKDGGHECMQTCH